MTRGGAAVVLGCLQGRVEDQLSSVFEHLAGCIAARGRGERTPPWWWVGISGPRPRKTPACGGMRGDTAKDRQQEVPKGFVGVLERQSPTPQPPTFSRSSRLSGVRGQRQFSTGLGFRRDIACYVYLERAGVAIVDQMRP